MKFYAISFALALPLLASAGKDQTINSGKMTMKFEGNSGGMKLKINNDDGTETSAATETSIKIKQDKLTEVLADGSDCPNDDECQSINVKGGGDWSDFVTTVNPSPNGEGNTTVSSTTFTVVEDGVTFKLMAHVSTDAFSVTDPVLCSGCVTGAGNCKNVENVCDDYAAAVAEEDSVATMPICNANFVQCNPSS
jgi:hypothetical protein